MNSKKNLLGLLIIPLGLALAQPSDARNIFAEAIKDTLQEAFDPNVCGDVENMRRMMQHYKSSVRKHGQWCMAAHQTRKNKERLKGNPANHMDDPDYFMPEVEEKPSQAKPVSRFDKVFDEDSLDELAVRQEQERLELQRRHEQEREEINAYLMPSKNVQFNPSPSELADLEVRTVIKQECREQKGKIICSLLLDNNETFEYVVEP